MRLRRDASIDDDQSHPIYALAACSKQKAGQDEEKSIILRFFFFFTFSFASVCVCVFQSVDVRLPYVLIDRSKYMIYSLISSPFLFRSILSFNLFF